MLSRGPLNPKSKLSVAYSCTGRGFGERFGGDQPAREGETEINSFNDELLRAGLANVVTVERTWLHINTPSDFEEAESILLAAR